MSSHLERRLKVQLDAKTKDELIEMIARMQIRHEAEKAKMSEPKQSADEVELIEQLGQAYFGGDNYRGLTLPMMAREIESDANACGHPIRSYLRRFVQRKPAKTGRASKEDIDAMLDQDRERGYYATGQPCPPNTDSNGYPKG